MVEVKFLEKRFQRVQDCLKKQNLDGAIISDEITLRWLTGHSFTGGNLVITPQKSVFLLNILSYDVVEDNKVFSTKLLRKVDDLKETVENLKIRKIGLETVTLPYDAYNRIVKLFPKHKFSGINISELRSVKDEAELKCIREAVRITDVIYSKVLEHVKPGMTELEVMTFVEQQMVMQGARGRSFDTIVGAAGAGAIPHYVPQQKPLENGDFVVLDFGVFYNDYCSDMTRTFLVGETPKHSEMLRVYEAVREANAQAIALIKPGVKCSEIHQVCVDVLRDRDYLKYFNHGTGHGFGLEIHEAPSLSAQRGETKLETGMVVTVEPGVYLPNIGGVRIEDDILVTATGNERLTRSTRKLVSIKAN